MKKTIITTLSFLVLLGFTITTGAMAQTWTWDNPIEVTTKVKEISGDLKSNAIYAIDNTGAVGLLATGDPSDGTAKTGAPVANAKDLVVGYGGLVYTIDDENLGILNEDPNPLADQQPKIPNGQTGVYTHIASGNNGKLYVLFETIDEKQYLLVGNPPFTAIDATVRFTPRSLNLDSLGKWVSCSIGGLPEGYTVDWANPEAVCITAINGDTEVEGLPICREDGPVNAGAKLRVKFSRQDLATAITNAGSPSSVTLTVTGFASAGEEDFEFTGTDTFKTKAKKIK